MRKIKADCEVHGKVEQDSSYFSIIHVADRDDYYYRYMCPGPESDSEETEKSLHIELHKLNEACLGLLMGVGLPLVEVNFVQARQNEVMPPADVLCQPINDSELYAFIGNLLKADPVDILAEAGKKPLSS